MSLNPGIRKLVALLNANGFVTVDSGDGVTHDHDCDREYAYVVCQTEPDLLLRETDGLVALMAKHGVSVMAQSEDGTPCIQATYDPIDGSALIDLMNVTDAMLVGVE